MERLVTPLRETLPKAFQQEAFEQEQQALSEKYAQQVRQIQQEFGRLVQAHGFMVQVDAMGDEAHYTAVQSGADSAIPLGSQPPSPLDAVASSISSAKRN